MAAERLDASRGPRSPLADINVTPLVDVMLVLLVIFIITAPMLQQGLNVDLPASQAGEVEPPPEEPLIVSVSAKGEVFLGEDRVELLELERRLRLVPAIDQRTVYLRADQVVAYGTVIQAMDAIKRAGVERLAMITVPLEPSRS